MLGGYVMADSAALSGANSSKRWLPQGPTVEPGGVPAPAGGHISAADYKRFTSLVYERCGIQLNASKQLMVETRLRKRLKATGVQTYREYWDLLNSGDGREAEMIRFIDVITTNKTDFFREPAHFDYLVKQILPAVGPQLKSSGRPLRVWSAGCSTGKEAYTLAMVLEDCRRLGLIGAYAIFGSDISTDVLAHAKRAIYTDEDIEPIPESLRKKYLLKSRGEPASFRIVPELRSQATFVRLNFMDERYTVDQPFDIVFCRNVIIYFDRPTQEHVINRLADCLLAGGYFFTGHSETLNGLSTRLISVAPTIYRKATAK